MKKYKCPGCLSTSQVIRYGYRGKIIRLFCNGCHRSFSFNPYFLDKKSILYDHLDGLSFRSLANKYKVSHMKIWRICYEELKKLPNNNQFTFNYCNRFSSVFVFDGKYFNVAESEHNRVLLWRVDYFRHDVPVFTVAPSENYQNWSKFFFYFRLLNHHPELLVCDDNINLKMAARKHFPMVKIQTCYNHFKENIRRELNVRSDPTYRYISVAIDNILSHRQPMWMFNERFQRLYDKYSSNPVAQQVLTNVQKNKTELLAYKWIRKSPYTNNLIECFNSHLETRLTPLKGFNSFEDARLWLNGYILKRRFTAFTSCSCKFRHLNGKKSIELTKKKEIVLPTLFG